MAYMLNTLKVFCDKLSCKFLVYKIFITKYLIKFYDKFDILLVSKLVYILIKWFLIDI